MVTYGGPKHEKVQHRLLLLSVTYVYQKSSTIDTIGPNWGMIGPMYQVKFLTHL